MNNEINFNPLTREAFDGNDMDKNHLDEVGLINILNKTPDDLFTNADVIIELNRPLNIDKKQK